VATKKKWMAEAFAGAHGQFKGKAKAHGKTTKEYAAEVTAPGSKATTKLKRQGNLAKMGMKYGGGSKRGKP